MALQEVGTIALLALTLLGVLLGTSQGNLIFIVIMLIPLLSSIYILKNKEFKPTANLESLRLGLVFIIAITSLAFGLQTLNLTFKILPLMNYKDLLVNIVAIAIAVNVWSVWRK